MSMIKYKILILLLLNCFMDTFFPSDLCLYKYNNESSVHGTKTSVVCQNIISFVLLLYCGPVSPRHNIICCVFQNIIIAAVLEILEFRVSSNPFTGMMKKENICIPDGIENAGFSLHYVGV